MYHTTKFDKDRRFALTEAEKLCLIWVLKQMIKIRPKEELFWLTPYIDNLYPNDQYTEYLHMREARVARLSILLFGGKEFVKPGSQVLKVNLLEKLEFMLSKRPSRKGK